MLDTIRLNLPFDVLAQHGIDVSHSPLMQWMWGRGFITLPTKSNGSYSPKFILRNDFGRRIFSISFSAPKLFYGNNLYEIDEGDGLAIFESLKEVLFRNMPILQWDILDHAIVQEVHFGRNFIFRDHTQPRALIDIIAKSKINEWLTYTERDYDRGGTCLRMHCDEYEICLYDKVHELKNSKARFDKKKGTIYEKYIEEQRKAWPFEVLRIEVRLKTSKKVKSIWSRGANSPDLNCRNVLWNHAPWLSFLGDTWSKIFKACYFNAQEELSPLEFLCALKGLGMSHSRDMFSLLWYHILQQDNPQLLNGTFYTPENAKRKAEDKKRYLNVMAQISTGKNKLEQISQLINANERFRPSNSVEDQSIIFQ